MRELRLSLLFIYKQLITNLKISIMGTEYQVLFAPNVGHIAFIKDGEQVREISNEEVDKLIEMLKEFKEE